MKSSIVTWKPTITVVVGPAGPNDSLVLEGVLSFLRKRVPAAVRVCGFSSLCCMEQRKDQTIVIKQHAVRVEAMMTNGDGNAPDSGLVHTLVEAFQDFTLTTERGIPDAIAHAIRVESSQGSWVRQFESRAM